MGLFAVKRKYELRLSLMRLAEFYRTLSWVQKRHAFISVHRISLTVQSYAARIFTVVQ